MAKRDYRAGNLPFPFVPIPREVLRGEEWAQLPPAACKLALDLAAQYTGKNNGRLTTAFEALQRVGWASKTTVIKAKAALMKTTFVMLTRKGHAPRTAEWVGFTWWKLDWHESMDISAKGWPYLNFMPALTTAKIDPNKRGEPPQEKRVVRSRNWTDRPRKPPSSGTETGPMDGFEATSSVQKLDHATEVNVGNSIGPETGHVLDVCHLSVRSSSSTAPLHDPATVRATSEALRLLDVRAVAESWTAERRALMERAITEDPHAALATLQRPPVVPYVAKRAGGLLS